MTSTDLAMLTARAPAPSKPSRSSEPVGSPEPVESPKSIESPEPVGPSKPVALAPLAAPAHVTVAEIPGRFAVIRHAVTIPRIPEFRFGLWITTTMITSESVHRLTASFA
ncbi:hypothetical protein [Streptomyces sp. IB201691-2A2]|uniref:hypothetical protein n=1 Tax=Streptomyces sp. IB201691-2A2 TaxID=2561920 RepID=UPI00163D58C9|nr:hypothetical protein [Streptomyces sp. IB201691-2A2]